MSRRPEDIHIIALVGFMGAGKTSVGRELAQTLGWVFVDVDAEIVSSTSRSIPQIFSEDGEAGFRRIESVAFQSIIQVPGPRVLALGGGTFVQPHNRRLLREAGALAVYLEASLPTLLDRCGRSGAGRPLLQFAERLFAERERAYQESDLKISTECKTVGEVAAELAAKFKAVEESQ